MIVGIGVDLCEIARIRDAIERRGESFARRILEPREFNAYQILNPSAKCAFLAKRFAAKESVAKALGIGIGRGFGFHDIAVDHDEFGRPLVRLNSNRAAFSGACHYQIHLSISDERSHAIAFCTIEDKSTNVPHDA
jgi:holo-[acyl-carrier protein] synthase